MSRVVKVRLSKIAINRAIKAYDNGYGSKPVSQCCPIFQALQTHFRGEVADCAVTTASLKNGTVLYLDLRAREVTAAHSDRWQLVKPMEFTVKIPQ